MNVLDQHIKNVKMSDGCQLNIFTQVYELDFHHDEWIAVVQYNITEKGKHLFIK